MTRTKWVTSMVAMLATVLGWSPLSYAASAPGKIGMEMVVLLPIQHHQLAVFEQVDMSTTVTDPVIGVIPHAIGIVGVGGTILKTASNYVVMSGTPKRFALKYDVPWNGRSISLLFPSYLATNALVLLAPTNLTLPEVLNPSLVPAGHGKLPGITNSPTFSEYATSNLAAGQGFQAVVESKVIAQTGSSLLLPGGGAFPVVGSLFEALLIVLGLGAVALGINWKPLSRYSRRAILRTQLLGELAALDASYHRGEMAEEAYLKQRAELVGGLVEVWEPGEPRVG